MKISSRLLVLALVAAATTFCSNIASAQPYKAKDGIAAARKNATDSLAPDAILTFIGTTGNLSAAQSGLPISITYNLATGDATAWAYVFYSPSLQQTRVIAVIKLIILYQALSVGTLPIQIPVSQKALDMTLPYANSDAMQGRLKKDTAFQRYMGQYPAASPSLISLGDIGVTDTTLKLPGSFPTNEPLWTMSFTGGGDSSMTCLVADKSGATYCQRVTRRGAGVNDRQTGGARAEMTVMPNPSNSRTRVAITLPATANPTRGLSVALYNSYGQKIYDLTESFVMSDFSSVEFDARNLPAGTYFCRVAGSDWTASSGGIILGER